LLQGGGVIVVAADVDAEKLEMRLLDSRLGEPVDEDRIHAAHDPLGAQRQEGAAGHGVRLEAKSQELSHEVSRAVEILDLVDLNTESLAEEAPEDLRVPLLQVFLAALLPEIRCEPRAVEVVVAIGHRRGEVSREVLRIKAVLRKDEAKVFLREPARLAGREQLRVPEGVAIAQPLERGQAELLGRRLERARGPRHDDRRQHSCGGRSEGRAPIFAILGHDVVGLHDGD
jgi:hypothetical protein